MSLNFNLLVLSDLVQLQFCLQEQVYSDRHYVHGHQRSHVLESFQAPTCESDASVKSHLSFILLLKIELYHPYEDHLHYFKSWLVFSLILKGLSRRHELLLSHLHPFLSKCSLHGMPSI